MRNTAHHRRANRGQTQTPGSSVGVEYRIFSLLGAHGYHAWIIEPTVAGCYVATMSSPKETESDLVPSLGQQSTVRKIATRI